MAFAPSAVNHTFGSLRGLIDTAIATFSGKYKDETARALLDEPTRPVHSYNPFVQIEPSSERLVEETRA